MRDVIERLSAAGELPSADQLVGVPGIELDAWELELGRPLPTDYRSFMEAAGATRNARLFSGDAFFWPYPRGLREDAREWLEPGHFAAIPSDAIFVLSHDAYIFFWIDTAESTAPVYVSQPVDTDVREIKRAADSFKEWLVLGLDN
ncbi:hypothetical protein BH10ACT3_BH10ACT3_24390 [soil metagenome]